MSKNVIAVVGGTGAQGGGVVEALLERGKFEVRVLTRNAEGDKARALAERGVDVVAADLADAASLAAAFAGAHGVFLVTNFWDPTTGNQEADRAQRAIDAAKAAGVDHLVWSTLPNAKEMSGGELDVHHFTGKALADDLVAAAGFAHHTFVEAPMYFQNFTGMSGPQPLPDGRNGWAVPMDPNKPVIHAGCVNDVGQVVARVFEEPERVGNGERLAVAPGLMSWADIVSTLNEQGHDLAVVQVPADVYDGFFPGAEELREMYQWFEGYTYFGPDADAKLARTRDLCPTGLTDFAEWAKTNMPAGA
jgi:uncharacterized protein YbjT (DUF2867 family)